MAARTAPTLRSGPTTERVTIQPSRASTRTPAAATRMDWVIAVLRWSALACVAAVASASTAAPTVGSCSSRVEKTWRNCG